MGKDIHTKYLIKTVPGDNTKELEDLLNEMAKEGWDLYSLHEIVTDEDSQYNCIFTMDDDEGDDEKEKEDVVNIKTFKSQMEKMLSSTLSPYESCKEIQEKIKEQRKKISKIKAQLELQSDEPSAKNRKHLNDEISKGLKELDDLRQNLIKVISPESMYSKISQDKLSIFLSEEILDLVNPDEGGALISETVKTRQKLVDKLGYVLPRIIFEDDDELNPYEFSIRIRGLDVVKSFAYPNYLMFFEEDLKLEKKLKGAIYAEDEITGKKIVWIEAEKTKDFWQNGLNAAEFIARLLERAVISNIDDLLEYSDVDKYVDIVSDKNMFLVDNIIPDFISVSELRYILLNLIREEVSIKDIIYIFEKINDFSDESSKEDLLDKIRLSLSKFISKKAANPEGVVQAFELGESTYKTLFSKVSSDDDIVRIDGKKVEKITKNILKKAKEYKIELNNLIVLAPMEVRHMTFIVLSQFISNIKVLAKEEISNEYTIEILDEI